MNAVEIIRQQARMCNSYPMCRLCPVLDAKGFEMSCYTYRALNPEKVVEIVEKWAKEHPEKTRKQDFLEKYPNVVLSGSGTPMLCAKYLGYCDGCSIDDGGYPGTCQDCWNLPFETRKD